MNIVEGYVVNPENDWCDPFALGEPKYSTKVNQQNCKSGNKFSKEKGLWVILWIVLMSQIGKVVGNGFSGPVRIIKNSVNIMMIWVVPNIVERSFIETLFLSLGEAKAKRKGGVFVGNKS